MTYPKAGTSFLAASACAALVFGATAMAQHAGHGSHTSPVATTPATLSSTAAFEAANAKMHNDMDIKFTGNADVDFVRGMIPHHEGAVAMAEIVLKHGKDAQVRKLAQEVIATQNKEIAWMRDWLKKHAK